MSTRNTTRTSFSGNRHTNVRRNTRINVNRNVNVNVNTRRRGGYYGGGRYNRGPSVAGVVAATIATAVVVGAIVSSLPPSCTTIMANGITYRDCGGTYYQPQYRGGSVQYIVVNHP